MAKMSEITTPQNIWSKRPVVTGFLSSDLMSEVVFHFSSVDFPI